MPRELERIPFLTEITLEWASGRREARISDLSMGGCYIDTIASIPEGEKVSFEISTADGREMPFSGTVAYVLDGFGFGVKFDDLNESQREFLNGVIAAKQ